MNPRDPNGQPEGVSSNPNALELTAQTRLLMKDIVATLTRTYTGFNWAIQPDELGKVFNVFCLDFSGRWGYVIRFADVQDDPARKQAVYAAGEILARFHYPLHRYDPVAMAAVPRMPNGEACPDLSDRSDRKSRRMEIERAYYGGKAKPFAIDGKLVVAVKQ